MLCTAFDGDSNAVTLDVLSNEDLDALRQANGLGSKNASTQGITANAKSKRYLILTYQGEFDKVHYPMALQYCEAEDVSELKRTIIRLRDELEAGRKSQIDSKNLRELEILVTNYKSERDKLAKELNDAASRASQLQVEVDSLRNENHLLRTRAEVLESQIRNPSSAWNRPPRLGELPLASRSRTSSMALSPVHSVRKSPIRSHPGSRASSPIRYASPLHQIKSSSSPYRQTAIRKPPLSQTRRDVSPRKSLTGSSPKMVKQYKEGHSPMLPISPRQATPASPIESTPPPVVLSEVDARLQALQNFLKHQKLSAVGRV